MPVVPGFASRFHRKNRPATQWRFGSNGLYYCVRIVFMSELKNV